MRMLQVALAWIGVALLGGAVLFGACARPISPPGGPRDFIPPMIASTWPDTFEVFEGTRDPVKITFSERISERPTQGTLDNAVLVSPVTGRHRVKHTRAGLEVEVIGGFQPGLVYRVRVLPTVKDLFNNTMEGPFELVFSTGAPYETNVIAGIVEDRITRKAVEGVRVEARERGVTDPPVYMSATDSVGVFALRYLPSGSYDLSLYEDVNRNTQVDFAELQGDTVGFLGPEPPLADTILLRKVSLLRPDTTPADLIRVEAMDSLLVRLGFSDFLDSEGSLDPVQIRIVPEEGPGPEISRLIWPRQVDSLRAVADSIATLERRTAMVDSLQIVADSLARVLSGMQAAGDTVGADTLGKKLDGIRARMAPPEPLRGPARAGPPGPPGPLAPTAPPPILPQQEFYVLLAESLVPDQLYHVTVSGVANINELGGGGGEASFTWKPPEPAPGEVQDTAGVVPDTAGVPPDTAGVVPDTGVVVPDTAGVPPDTAGVPPDTAGVPPDTGQAVPGAPRRGTPPLVAAAATPMTDFRRHP
ncbi:MAG: Ig-like domain-containing protein [Gemmatimonadota bacterium]